MPSSDQRYLSGLGDAEESFGVDEEASRGGGSGAPAPGGSGASVWETVLEKAASTLPILAEKLPEAYRTYEEAHGHIPHAGGGEGGPSPHGDPARPWYESPGFLVVAGLGLGIVVVIATRRK